MDHIINLARELLEQPSLSLGVSVPFYHFDDLKSVKIEKTGTYHELLLGLICYAYARTKLNGEFVEVAYPPISPDRLSYDEGIFEDGPRMLQAVINRRTNTVRAIDRWGRIPGHEMPWHEFIEYVTKLEVIGGVIP